MYMYSVYVYAVACISEISLIVTLNKQFTPSLNYELHQCWIVFWYDKIVGTIKWNYENMLDFNGKTAVIQSQNRSIDGRSIYSKSGDTTSSGENGLKIRTNLSQVPGAVI